MGYFMPVSSATQRRLAQVIEKRKADEDEQMQGFGSLGDIAFPDQPLPLAPRDDPQMRGLTAGMEVMPGEAYAGRRGATQQEIRPGVPRPTDVEAREQYGAGEVFPEVSFRSYGNLLPENQPFDLSILRWSDPNLYRQIQDYMQDATLEPTARYGVKEVVKNMGIGNTANTDPLLLTAGTHTSPTDQVPLDGEHSRLIVISPEQARDDIFLDGLVRSGPAIGNMPIREEGESRFGTLSAGEAMGGLGRVLIGFVDVASAPFEAFAETAFQATHTLPWNTTMWENGFTATVEKHRSRGIIAQIAIGVVFDPFIIGKGLKIPAGLTRLAARAFIRKELAEIPDLTDQMKNDLLKRLEDSVVDPETGLTFDFENQAWWSPAQKRWIPTEGGEARRAHAAEFPGAGLSQAWRSAAMEGMGVQIAGGSMEAGETFGRARATPGVRQHARELGVDIDELASELMPDDPARRRISMGDVDRAAAARTQRIGAETEQVLDDLFENQGLAATFDQAAADAGLVAPRMPEDPGSLVGLSPYETVTPGATRSRFRSAESIAEYDNMTPVEQANSLFHGDLPPMKKPFTKKLHDAGTNFQEAWIDKTVQISQLTDRVTSDVLEGYNKWAIKNGLQPLYRLPDDMNAYLHTSLGFGAPAAADDAVRIVDKRFKLTLNPTGYQKLDSTIVEAVLTLQHHISVARAKNAADVMAGVVRSGSGWVNEALYGGLRQGPKHMSAYEMRESLAKFKRSLEPENMAQHEAAKAEHIRTELANKSAAMQAGQEYTEIPFRKTDWERVNEAAQVIVDHYGHIRTMSVENGTLSREMAEHLQIQYPFYNPIRYIEGTIMPHVEVTRAGRARVMGVNQDTLYELSERGLGADVQRPLQVLTKATMDAYTTHAYNKAVSSLIEAARVDTTLPVGLIRKVVTLEPGQKLLAWEVGSAEMVAKQLEWRRQGIELVRIGRMVRGEHEIWLIPKEYADAVGHLAKFDQSMPERVLRMANRPFRMLFTSHNPVFMAANFLHDMMVVMMNEGVMPWSVMSSLGATLTDVIRRDDMLHALIQAGGDVGGLSGRFGDEMRAELLRRSGRLAEGMTEFSTYDQFLRLMYKSVEPLNYLSRAIEMAPRRATFRKVLEREDALRRQTAPGLPSAEALDIPIRPGGPEAFTEAAAGITQGAPVPIGGRGAFPGAASQKMYSPEAVRAAAYAARNVTVDFQRHGHAIKLFDAAFLYTNAAIQGSLLPLRAWRRGGVRLGAAPGVPTFARTEGPWGGLRGRLRDHKAKIGTLGFASVALSIYAHNAIRFPNSYRNMSLQDRLTRLQVIVDEEEDEQGNWIPKSFSMQPLLREYSAVNAAVVLTMDKAFDRNAASVTQFLTTLTSQVNPAGTVVSFGGRDSSFGMQPLPAPTMVSQTFNEVTRNWDSFRNAPIVGPDLAGLPKEDQYDQYTSETAKRLGGFLKQSPKMIDHIFRIGAAQDIFMGLDHAIQLADKNEPDPVLKAHATELKRRLDLIVDPTELRRVRNEYFTGEAIPSKDRRKIELIMDQEPTGIPVATSLIDRFYRESGGQMRRTGIMIAAEETGTDPQQTSRMAASLGRALSGLQDQQLQWDAALNANKISHKEWIAAERKQGFIYQGAFLTVMLENPDAAQSLLGPEGLRSPAAWKDYKDIMATGGNLWADHRNEGQLLASIQRGIEMPWEDEVFGLPDYYTYFKHIDEFRDGLTVKQIALLNAELESLMTPMQKIHFREIGLGAAEGGLRAYWDIAGQVAEGLPGLQGQVYRAYLDANDAERGVLKREFAGLISASQRIVNLQREAFRRNNPYMDYLYVKWGYAEAGRTVAGEAARQEVLAGAAPSAFELMSR